MLFDILILLSTALVLGVVCERLRQSAILGYLAAGTLLGPNALQFISSASEVSALAELGVALLLFTIGLEFSWPRLRRLGAAALGGGTAQVVLTMVLGAMVALSFGMSARTALAIGAIVALSSTACVLRLLVSRAEIESNHGRHALGILLMQDIAVVPLVLLVTVLGGQGSLQQVGVDVFKTLGWACILLVVLFLLLNRVVPRVLHLESLHRNRDLPILLAIVTGLGSAWGSHKLGLSPALGAFVAGMLLAESPFATQVRADIASIRTLLVTLFFSSIGMLGDPAWFVRHLPAVLALVVAIVAGKAVIIWVILRLFRLTHTNALAAGICLGQVGEFSFVLAAVGRGTIISDDLFTLVISATITTLFLTPYLVALAPQLSVGIVARLSKMKLIAPASMQGAADVCPPKRPLVIIGFGPAGQAVGQTLERLADRVTVIDLNPNMIRKAQQLELSGHIGDAMHADVLEHAGITSAAAAVVTIPDPTAARAIVELIRSIAPEVHIIARARYHRYSADLQAGGAHEVIDEEQFVGARLAARLRKRLRAVDRPATDD
ncbi:MAG: sodium:proton exchanger [Phycisphaerales bacterium]|nr:sodium:proton exchanger [Phycisphaerales bacterium]NNM26603.1 sodium:proton exchanger [Phycisphaerales bacterium]